MVLIPGLHCYMEVKGHDTHPERTGKAAEQEHAWDSSSMKTWPNYL